MFAPQLGLFDLRKGTKDLGKLLEHRQEKQRELYCVTEIAFEQKKELEDETESTLQHAEEVQSLWQNIEYFLASINHKLEDTGGILDEAELEDVLKLLEPVVGKEPPPKEKSQFDFTI